MSRAQGNKIYNNFSRGLITEASYLAFPENATTDELNCDIQENGVRVRRYGFDANGTWGTSQRSITFGQNERIHSFVWRSVSKDGSINFLCVQWDTVIEFWLIDGSSNLSKKSFTIDLTTHLVSGAANSDIKENYVQFTSGKGELFIAHPYLEPLRVVYDSGGDSITTSEITIKIRDFVGLDDGLAVDEEPTTLSDEHHYNLRNQGWIDPEATNTGTTITSYDLFGAPRTYSYPTTTGPIAEYFTAESRYPGNNKIWWSSKDSNGDFDPAGLTKLFFGNTRAPRGHFILDAFNKDYSAVSGVSGITAVTESTRPRAVEFFSGRVFWAHKSDIYFSPILEDGSRAGQCFQEADPTSEDISDLIVTDGGYIPFPNAEDIVQLQEMGDGIVIFATNGIWFLTGGSSGFSATDYTIYKVSEIGTDYARSVVKADSQLYWWSDTGIHAMQQAFGQFGPIAGQFEQNNISIDTIDTFYNNITRTSRNSVTGVYDPASQKVVWLYSSGPALGTNEELYGKMLWFDVRNQAFVPWAVDPVDSGVSAGSGLTYSHKMLNVFVSTEFATNTEDETFLEFLYADVSGNEITQQTTVTLGNFVNQDYVDWADATGASTTTFDSYLITGHELLEDGTRRKQAPHVGIFFRRSEDSVTDEGGGEYSIDNESSCFFEARWDWSNRSDGRWTTPIQVYRPLAIPFIDPASPSANPGVDVVWTKTKVRGSGRALQFKFSETRAGYGFELLGWQVFFETKTRP